MSVSHKDWQRALYQTTLRAAAAMVLLGGAFHLHPSYEIFVDDSSFHKSANKWGIAQRRKMVDMRSRMGVNRNQVAHHFYEHDSLGTMFAAQNVVQKFVKTYVVTGMILP